MLDWTEKDVIRSSFRVQALQLEMTSKRMLSVPDTTHRHTRRSPPHKGNFYSVSHTLPVSKALRRCQNLTNMGHNACCPSKRSIRLLSLFLRSLKRIIDGECCEHFGHSHKSNFPFNYWIIMDELSQKKKKKT